ncbi:MAG: MBL fold metallo-hydrolase [Desulfobacteraceae bacterium]|nr:MBL fold metallo-hydrolase [Desulfobacteraceae bacterium]
MTAIRTEGKINEDTTLIDVMMLGQKGGIAMYLIESGEKCLIDGGVSIQAQYLIESLEKLNSFPPDIIIITHAHWDHTQAIPAFREKAAELGKKIEVMASKEAIPLLKDQSFNDIFNMGPYENIDDVTPLSEGDTIDLKGITLKIFDVPGHSRDHIAILDERNKNIFVGDAIGSKLTDDTASPAFMPPFFDKEVYYESMKKLKDIDYDTLCLSHFGYIYGEEAKTILDEEIDTLEKWWQLFEDNMSKFDDINYMADTIIRNCYPKTINEEETKIGLLFAVPWFIQAFKI